MHKGLRTYSGYETSNLNLNGIGFDILTMTSSVAIDTPSWYATLKIVEFSNPGFKFSKAFRQSMKNCLREDISLGENTGISVLNADEPGNSFSVGDFILINTEVMKITVVNTTSNIIDVERAQWGTRETTHDLDDQIFVAQPGFCRKWIGIRVASEVNKISIQAQSVVGDNITNDAAGVIDPTTRDDYVEIQAQDFISGVFDYIYIEEPPAHGFGTATNLTLMAIRG